MLLLRWLLNALALILVANVVSGFHVDSFWAALIAALVLGLVNAIIRPILLVLTLPINILTLGIFTFVVNALMILLASSILEGFEVDGFGPAFWGSILLWLISMVTGALLSSGKDRPLRPIE
jgi:putative membrane protein